MIKQYFKGSQSQFEAYLKKNGLTDDYVRNEIELPSISAAEGGRRAEEARYGHRRRRPGLPDQQGAVRVRSAWCRSARRPPGRGRRRPQALAGGAGWTKAARIRSHRPADTGEPFTATNSPGSTRTFRKAGFTLLKTGSLSAVLVRRPTPTRTSRASASPTATSSSADRRRREGDQQTFDSVKAQIRTQLLSTQKQSHVTSAVRKLQAAQKKLTNTPTVQAAADVDRASRHLVESPHGHAGRPRPGRSRPCRLRRGASWRPPAAWRSRPTSRWPSGSARTACDRPRRAGGGRLRRAASGALARRAGVGGRCRAAPPSTTSPRPTPCRAPGLTMRLRGRLPVGSRADLERTSSRTRSRRPTRCRRRRRGRRRQAARRAGRPAASRPSSSRSLLRGAATGDLADVAPASPTS